MSSSRQQLLYEVRRTIYRCRDCGLEGSAVVIALDKAGRNEVLKGFESWLADTLIVKHVVGGWYG